MSENTFEKISDTEFKEIIKQKPIEIVGTLDDLLVQKLNLEDAIKSNQDQIVFLQNELAALNIKILTVKNLGVSSEN